MLEAEELEEEETEIVEEEDGENGIEEDAVHISVHALSGIPSYRTMRIKGKVKKCPITILIDSGSTHNFLDPAVAKRSGQQPQATSPLAVVVVDGTRLFSSAVISNFTWQMQGTEFHSEVRLLPLGGCDMVLRVQWLTTLGPVLWDFKELRMEFQHQGKKHVLRGGNASEVLQVSSQQMQALLKKKSMGFIA